MKLEETKKLQNVFKTSERNIKRKIQIRRATKCIKKILNCLTNHEKLLLNYLMIIFLM